MTLTFGIYRILGNDLPPRHHPEQTYRNTKFILENEDRFPETTRRFVVNRIIDLEKEAALISMLQDYGAEFTVIPFLPAEYANQKTPEGKIRYIANLNAARNFCIDEGIKEFDLTLPLDGATFLRQDGWFPFEDMVYQYRDEGAYLLATTRVDTFEAALDESLRIAIREEYKFGGGRTLIGMRETSMAFTKHIDCRFNEELRYGMVDKVELLWRLGVPGPWDRWEPHIRKEAYKKLSKWAGVVKSNGFVFRLPSHDPAGDGDNLQRGHNRNLGIENIIAEADKLI
jgi:hypothetical protein